MGDTCCYADVHVKTGSLTQHFSRLPQTFIDKTLSCVVLTDVVWVGIWKTAQKNEKSSGISFIFSVPRRPNMFGTRSPNLHT